MTEREVYDQFGRRRVVPVRTFQERKGFILRPKFIFIDGRTGATLYSETFNEQVLYNAQQNTPALSSYFELMDKLIPSFLNALSTQKVRGIPDPPQVARPSGRVDEHLQPARSIPAANRLLPRAVTHR